MDPGVRLKELVIRAGEFQFDQKIPAFRYLRSTKEMERMALVYSNEGQYENAFLLYMKMITLLVEKLPRHKEYKILDSELKKQVKKRSVDGLKAAEKIKDVLRKRYLTEYEAWEREEENNKKKMNTLQYHGKSQETEKDPWKLSAGTPVISFSSTESSEGNDINNPSTAALATTVYPSVPLVSSMYGDIIEPSAPPVVANSIPHDLSSAYQPSAPPSDSPPPPYTGAVDHSNAKPVIDRTSKPSLSNVPEIYRHSKPADTFCRQDSTSLDGNRSVIISNDLVPKFLQLASSNTKRNLETCGILTGKLAQNKFRITHLVVPKQSATPDSCTTESEEELFDVQDKHDLITLGWIHTHPSQTCFLSSVDLHTQCSYQQMLPEAIAIVCSPRYNTTGIYRLTLTHGLKFVTSCSKSGFHPHPKEPPLFEESPLVSVEASYAVEVIDLR